jgi:YbbR domain-containing protein
VQTSDRGWLARLFLDNYPLKLVALVFAIALFSIVHSDQDAQRSLYVDVVALLPAANSESVLVSTLPARVKITLRGSRSRIAALEHDDFAPVQMDLRDAGRQYYYFDASSVGVSGPFRVVAIEPANVQLTWRPRAERTIPVRAKLNGTPQPDHAVRQPIVIGPSTVAISGPKDELDLISYCSTEDINIDGLGAGVHERRARLEPLSGHVTYVAQSAVSVRVDIVSETSERTFAGLDVAAVGPGDVSLRPKSVQVTVRGPAAELGKLTEEQIVPYVEPTAELAASGVESLAVQLRGVPEACSVVRIAPSSVLARHAH